MKGKLLLLLSIILNILLVIWAAITLSYKPEDVNKDGKVDIKDLLIVKKYILENE